MKTISIYYHQLLQIAITFQLTIIAIAMPSASLADVNYYKALVIGHFQNLRCNYNHDTTV